MYICIWKTIIIDLSWDFEDIHGIYQGELNKNDYNIYLPNNAEITNGNLILKDSFAILDGVLTDPLSFGDQFTIEFWLKFNHWDIYSQYGGIFSLEASYCM